MRFIKCSFLSVPESAILRDCVLQISSRANPTCGSFAVRKCEASHKRAGGFSWFAKSTLIFLKLRNPHEVEKLRLFEFSQVAHPLRCTMHFEMRCCLNHHSIPMLLAWWKRGNPILPANVKMFGCTTHLNQCRSCRNYHRD